MTAQPIPQTAATVTGFFHAPSSTISYVLADESTRRCAIIDPVLDFDFKSGRTGTVQADRVVSYVRAQGLTVSWILETHAHADHLSAAHYLREELGVTLDLPPLIENGNAVPLTVSVESPMSEADYIKAARAKPMDPAQYPDVYRTVEQLSQKAGEPMPRLYLSPSPQLNAFATGRNPKNAAVCVNQGLYEALTAEELEGVIGHELQHVYNRDILVGSARDSRDRVTAIWMSSAPMGARIIAAMAMMGFWLSRLPPKKSANRDRNVTAAASVAATDPTRMSRL